MQNSKFISLVECEMPMPQKGKYIVALFAGMSVTVLCGFYQEWHICNDAIVLASEFPGASMMGAEAFLLHIEEVGGPKKFNWKRAEIE